MKKQQTLDEKYPGARKRCEICGNMYIGKKCYCQCKKSQSEEVERPCGWCGEYIIGDTHKCTAKINFSKANHEISCNSNGNCYSCEFVLCQLQQKEEK
jgi:hypothetical protein